MIPYEAHKKNGEQKAMREGIAMLSQKRLDTLQKNINEQQKVICLGQTSVVFEHI